VEEKEKNFNLVRQFSK